MLFIDSLGAGGAQRQMVYLASTLKDSGYEVKLISYYDEPFYLNAIQRLGINYECIFEAGSHFTRIYYINKAIKKYNPNIVIAYLDTPCIVACICRLLQFKRWKLIVSERNTTQKLTLHERIKFFLYRVASLVVPNAYAQENFIKAYYPSLKKKTRTIINMVDLKRFSPIQNEQNSKILRITIVATIWPSKNTKGFIEAVKRVVENGNYDFKIDWYGIGNSKYCQEAIDLVKQYQLDSNFSILPKTPTIEKEYQQSDWFCLPSFYEGTPNVICEAMACGLPILCSNVCDNGHYVQDGVNGYLFDPTSIEDMSRSLMEALKTSAEKRKIMGTKSRQIAEEKLSYMQFRNNYLQAIEEVTKRCFFNHRHLQIQ